MLSLSLYQIQHYSSFQLYSAFCAHVVAGDHTITLKYGDTELSGSPFFAKAYNTAAIEVTKLPDGVVGQPIEFGSKKFEILIPGICVTMQSARFMGIKNSCYESQLYK